MPNMRLRKGERGQPHEVNTVINRGCIQLVREGKIEITLMNFDPIELALGVLGKQPIAEMAADPRMKRFLKLLTAAAESGDWQAEGT